MILLLCSLALAQDTTLELVVTDADVGGEVVAPVEGATVDLLIGRDSGSGLPTVHRELFMQVRRYTDAHSHTLLQASTQAVALDTVVLRAFVPHPVNAGERLVVQETTFSGPAWIYGASVTLDANLPRGRETLSVTAAAVQQVSYTYDEQGTLTGTVTEP